MAVLEVRRSDVDAVETTGGHGPSRTPRHNLRRLREAQGLTQREVAWRIGAEPLAVRRYEHGQEQIPERRQARLATAFGVSVAHLMGSDN